MYKIIVLLVSAVGFVANACEPTPTNSGDYVFGDSLGAQILPAINAENDGRTYKVMTGADLAYWQSEVDAAIAARPRSITLALGSNDAGTWKDDGGWSAEDNTRWRLVIRRAHDAGICVAVVLPWFLESVEEFYPGVRTQVDSAREALLAMPFDSIVDWRPKTESNPEIMAPDGIHIAAFGVEYTAPVAARYEVVDQSAQNCAT
jgi:hypothetical protein